jgi:PhzF family phenazine biosynthesis protein
MELKLYQVDAFTDKVFSGNPAAVCPLNSWLPDDILQRIALENNLAETAYYVREKEGYRIRWFTPTVEVDLCGHATLASAFILFNHEGYKENQIIFNSRSGPLTVTKEKDFITLNFPTDTLHEVEMASALTEPFPIKPIKALKGKSDYMLVFENEGQVKSLVPDFRKLALIKSRGVIVTAKGDETDFVSRFFGPQSGIDEDPATGSAHTTLIPYWAKVLGKTELTAFQCSARGGTLYCKLNGDRVDISGQGVLYLTGKIFIS